MRRPFKRWEREWVERDRALRKNVLYRSLLTACGTTYCFRDYLFLAGQSQKISCRIDLLSSGTLIFPLSKTKFISCCVCPVYPYCPGFCALEYPDSSCSCPILFLCDYPFLSILSWFLPCVILTVFVPALSNSYCPIFYPNSDYPSYVPCPFLSIMSWILSCLIQTTAFPNVTYSDYPASCPVFSILSWLLPGHIHSSLIPSLSYPCCPGSCCSFWSMLFWFLPILFRLPRFYLVLLKLSRFLPSRIQTASVPDPSRIRALQLLTFLIQTTFLLTRWQPKAGRKDERKNWLKCEAQNDRKNRQMDAQNKWKKTTGTEERKKPTDGKKNEWKRKRFSLTVLSLSFHFLPFTQFLHTDFCYFMYV